MIVTVETWFKNMGRTMSAQIPPGNGQGVMTFSLTTQTFDGAGVIETHAGSSGTAGTVGAVTFSTNGDNTLTLTNGNSSSNNLFGIGTQITFEVVSTTKIRATVVAYPAGTGGNHILLDSERGGSRES